MRIGPFRLKDVRVITASAFAVVIYGVSAVSAAEPPGVEQLPALCLRAKAAFRPLTAADVQAAKTNLDEALVRLDRRLTADGRNGADWRKYLKWEAIQTELAREGPDQRVLNALYERYNAGQEGLGLIWFLDVRQALRRYMETIAGVDNPKLKADYENLMDSLAEHLKAHTASPTQEQAEAIGAVLRWLEDARQAPALVHAIRYHFVRANLFAELSPEVVGAGVAGPVDDIRPVRESILGTEVVGSGHTRGQTKVSLVPDTQRGVVDTVFHGVTDSQTVGYHGPVEVYALGTTWLGACKRFWVNADGVFAHPAAASAITETTITDICSVRGRRMVERLAWRRAGQQKCQSEEIAARRAEFHLNLQIDAAAAGAMHRANDALVNKVRKPLQRRSLFPQQVQVSTTEDGLHVVSLRAAAAQLAAPTSPPPLPEACDMSVRLHESMVNNMAASALAGMLLREESFQAMVVEILGELPERLQSDEEQEPWAIQFAPSQPISVRFADEQFRVTLRGQRYYRGEEVYPGMDVTAIYKIQKTAEGFKAVRQGVVQIFPPGFVPESGKQLTPRQVAIRRLLAKRFDRIFDPEILGEGFMLPGKWSRAGKMKPTQLHSQGGWLAAAWKLAPAEQPPSTAESGRLAARGTR
jgi:hypothetical protein